MAQSNYINRTYGTWRGAVRLALSYPQHMLGLGAQPPADPSRINRLVFVCRGNISRSAYADQLCGAKGLAGASFGVAAGTGNAADPVAVKVAVERGLDMTGHQSCTAANFAPQEGDVLLAMEVRQLSALAQDERLFGLPRELLGHYCGTPHLHDPFMLCEDYYRTCFDRIDRAVARLAETYPAAKL